LAGVTKSRWKALARRKISDDEAFRRPLGGYYRDRFMVGDSRPPERLNILFAAPYPIEPPVHGGAVFMKEALEHLASKANVHLVSFVDFEKQLSEQRPLLAICASATFMWRPYVPPTEKWTLDPYGVREFAFRDFAWLLHRTIYTKDIDVVQLEYTSLGQYAGEYKHIPCILFEHDIAFQALRRRIRAAGATRRLLLEYVRMRLYEPKLLRRVARVQVCTRAGADFLQHLVPRLKGRIDWNVRAGIDVCKYNFVLNERETDTLLFVGSFRHLPNRYALTWFVEEVLPIIVRSRPGTVLVVVGSDPPQSDAVWINHPHVRVLGAVTDVRSPLERYCVFVCPVRSGSGVRVKLLEAFACGIPAVSTSIGAEGLTSRSGEICELADTPVTFAAATLKLLQDGDYRTALAERARRMVERDRNSRDAASRLEATYRAEVNRLRIR
jgi:glycosyltransferase involved in cell wall biosynthesis